MKRIYVGNLPYTATDEELRTLFGRHGAVHSVRLVNDRDTGQPRGFGFVEMDDEAADAAVSALDGSNFGGRNLRVNEAREREERGPRRGEGNGGRSRAPRAW